MNDCEEAGNPGIEPTDPAPVAGNGGNGGGGGCIFVAIGPVEHSHNFHAVGGRLPAPISFQFEIEAPAYGSDTPDGTVSVAIDNVQYTQKFRLDDDLHFEFSFKRGHSGPK
jgi:hypothetical protein